MALAAEGPKGRCKVARAREATRPLAGVVAGLQARSAKLTLPREMCVEAAMKAPGPTPEGQLAMPERLSLDRAITLKMMFANPQEKETKKKDVFVACSCVADRDTFQDL